DGLGEGAGDGCVQISIQLYVERLGSSEPYCARQAHVGSWAGELELADSRRSILHNDRRCSLLLQVIGSDTEPYHGEGYLCGYGLQLWFGGLGFDMRRYGARHVLRNGPE